MSQKRQPEEGERPWWGGCGTAESGGSSSAPHRPGEPKRQRVPALREVIAEVMRKSSIEKLFSSIEPLIRRVDWVVCMGISQAIIWYLGKLFPLVAVMVIIYIITSLKPSNTYLAWFFLHT